MKQVRSIQTVRVAAMAVALALPSSGCSQLKRLTAENAKLTAERDCYDRERQALARDLADEEKRTRQAEKDAADARTQAAGQTERADALAGQVKALEARISQLDAQIKELLDALEKAWARRGRSRSFVDELIKLDRSGGDVKLSYDGCNGCEKPAG